MASFGEAFGRPYAEAMASGLPVIAPAWGGQMDFLNKENSILVDGEMVLLVDGQMVFEGNAGRWYSVNEVELAEAFKELAGSPELAEALGKRGRNSSSSLHPDFVAGIIRDRIREIVKEYFAKKPEL